MLSDCEIQAYTTRKREIKEAQTPQPQAKLPSKVYCF